MWLESTVLRRRRVPSGCVSAAFDRARKDSAGPNHATALSRAYIDLMNVRHARRERRQAAGGGRADTAKKALLSEGAQRVQNRFSRARKR